MPSTKYGLLRLLTPLVFLLLGCPPPAPAPPPPNVFIEAAPNADLSTGLTVLGATAYLAPESQGAFLVQVHAPYSQEPQPDTRVKVLLGTPNGNSRELFRGQTDEYGLLSVNFDVPTAVAEPNQVLTIVADTAAYGQLQTSQAVYIGRVYNVLLSTDKPVYQPGQPIHLRALALDTTAMKAAQEQPLVITVTDPAGNKLLRQELATSAFGIASTDFQLDSQASSGDYLITATMGPVTSSRTVEVKPYTLPRFQIDFTQANAFYQPGAIVTGTVAAHYFFGKPVAGGQVSIQAFVTDVERVQLFERHGVTDDQGSYAYEFQLPDSLVGQLENNTAQVDLQITVVDQANHRERVEESVIVAEQSILIEAIPESGMLRAGLENVIYLQTSYPDGRAAPTTLTITGLATPTQTVPTDEFGLATITITPTTQRDLNFTLTAVDAAGQAASAAITLGGSGAGPAVLLRPEKVQYQIGETLNVDIHVATANSEGITTAYLDIIKGRQTFGLAALPVAQGVAQAAIDLDGSLLGTLELNAYVITAQGDIVRDRRLILVNPAPAAVTVQANADVYRPGETATLAIQVQREGKPMAGVIGLSIVDESVFAIGTQEPGFARTYFLLDRELQEPRYEIHDFAPLQGSDPSPYDKRSARSAQQLALAGFFAEELAAMAQPAAVAVAATGTPAATQAWGWANRIALGAPLLGLAFYDGSRRRRYGFIGLVLLSLALFWTSCAVPAAPAGEMAAPASEAPAALAIPAETTATRGEPGEPPRLRQFFPETLFWQPELTTDANGQVQVEVPIADSITTWRVSVLASDQDGNLGSAEMGMRVFQDFFVEPDLPRFLTVGDEVAVPVSLFNYLAEAQAIQLQVSEAAWFDFVEAPQLNLTLAPNEVTVAYIPIRVTAFGQHDFQLTATGSHMSDAVRRPVEVLPDGKAQATAMSGKLAATQSFTVAVPAQAIPGTPRLTVKIYPGIVSQMIDGLEGMLQQPYGCFEQTSSTTYPNVLVLDYLKTTGQINPRVQLQAEQYIGLGYQRLLSFEVPGMPGGFSLFGEAPAQTMLTAYGLMEFTDMSQVSYVDPLLLERTALFLFQRQQADGSWTPQGATIESGLEGLGQDPLLATAYVTWALADAGYANSEPVQRAVGYLQSALIPYLQPNTQLGTATSPLAAPAPPLDPYAASMLVNALIAADPQGSAEPIQQLINHLLTTAQRDAQDQITWASSMTTFMGGYGNVSGLESAAMTAIALLRTQQHLDVAEGALDWIISQRNPNGMFYSTQTTVLALKALRLAAEQGGEAGTATVTISLNGDRTQQLTITDATADVVQFVTFDDIALRGNALTMTVEGERALQYQVVADYYLPWSAIPPTPAAEKAVAIAVTYDRTELAVNDLVNVTAAVELLAPGMAGTLLVDLGIPPGFQPLTEDLDALVAQGLIARYELTGRQILVYLTNVPSGQRYTLPYRLQARFPIQAQVPSSQAYDYYTPEQQETAPPQRVIVRLGTPEK
ncbi:MAG: hypothetical protein KF832_09945 [Caldilineaceae bacterium]|nr:hypothetical protein [Caldilineaceae bacterium]